MSRITEYCNVTTDLQEVVKNIEKYAYQTLDNNKFSAESGEVYSNYGQIGYVGAVWVAGEEQSVAANAAGIDATTTWYYDSTTDTLHLLTSIIGNNDVDIAPDSWDNIKDDAREWASQEVEAWLYMYQSPLPYRRNSNKEFDKDIVRATAILTCRNIVRANNPEDDLVDKLTNDVVNRNEQGEIIGGVLGDYIIGVKKFSFEATLISYNGLITPVSVSGTGGIELAGISNDLDYHLYNVEITTGGAVGTAKYQLTKDGTVIGSYTTDLNYSYIPHFGGAYIRFYGTFTVGDEWNIEYDGRAKKSTEAGIGSIRISH